METLPRLLPLAFLVFLVLSSVPRSAQSVETVVPSLETAVPPGASDADDAAIWVHPTRRSRSTVIGTYKDAGLAVYDLDGNLLQFLPGLFNNADVRYRFRLGTDDVALVATADRGNDELAVFAVDPDTRMLRDVAARELQMGITVYGSCLYRSRLTGALFFFVNSQAGEVEQWRLYSRGGRVDAVHARTFDVGGQVEGCVADDETGFLFIGEEDVGIWRYQAEPGAGTARVMVDSTGSGGNITADVEGLTIYYASGGLGYLVASSQGDNTFTVYDRRPPHGHLLTFEVGPNSSRNIDGVTASDGIDVVNLDLGPSFPGGVFVTHDDSNPGAGANFKLVSWTEIASAANPPLRVDTAFDPKGSSCYAAAWQHRNGTGINPTVLVNRTPPRLGSRWEAELDCSGHAPANAHLFAFALPLRGSLGQFGEMLADPSSTRYFHLAARHSGNRIRFGVDLPASPSLCGLVAIVQGRCDGSPGPQFSNAIDLRIGR